jgi:hypothetical protein
VIGQPGGPQKPLSPGESQQQQPLQLTKSWAQPGSHWASQVSPPPEPAFPAVDPAVPPEPALPPVDPALPPSPLPALPPVELALPPSPPALPPEPPLASEPADPPLDPPLESDPAALPPLDIIPELPPLPPLKPPLPAPELPLAPAAASCTLSLLSPQAAIPTVIDAPPTTSTWKSFSTLMTTRGYTRARASGSMKVSAPAVRAARNILSDRVRKTANLRPG